MAEAPSSGFLTLLNESLSFAPERSDLWMTRFDILRSLGYKKEFTQSVVEAATHARIRRELDWPAVRRMWAQIAPDERFPADAEEVLRRPGAAPVPSGPEALLPDLVLRAPRLAEGRRERVLRFNDVAMQIAGPQLAALTRAWVGLSLRQGFLDDYVRTTRSLLQRPTPLEFSASLSQAAGEGRRIYLKREDRRGLPAEAEQAAAQCWVASQLGKTGVITANDVDLHALEVATAAPFFKLKCTIVVRPADFDTKASLIQDLESLGAAVVAMPDTGLLSTDPREGAVRAWLRKLDTTHLALSLGMAPAPYTAMANAFQSAVGREAASQYDEMASLLKRPRTLVAAVGSEADAIGFALPFLGRKDLRIAFAEPEPGGIQSWKASGRLAAYHGQIREHSWLRGVGRIQHVPVADRDAENYRARLARDGINVGLEDARAVALALLLSQGDPTPRDFMVLLG